MRLTRKEKWGIAGIVSTIAAIVAVTVGSVVLVASCTSARAEEITCPQGAPSCKIITLTPQEEHTLTGPNAIFDMAQWASRPLGDWIAGWKDKIAKAPAGKPFVAPLPPEKPKQP